MDGGLNMALKYKKDLKKQRVFFRFGK